MNCKKIIIDGDITIRRITGAPTFDDLIKALAGHNDRQIKVGVFRNVLEAKKWIGVDEFSNID